MEGGAYISYMHNILSNPNCSFWGRFDVHERKRVRGGIYHIPIIYIKTPITSPEAGSMFIRRGEGGISI